MRHEDIPEINNPKIRFPVLEGDKVIKEVDNGGYNVQQQLSKGKIIHMLRQEFIDE